MIEKDEALKAALIGKAGEALVAAELLRRHIDVAYPAFDGGVDLLAYSALKFDRVIPIQVKARSKSGYTFQKSWFKDGNGRDIPGLVLVQVWNVRENPEFYIFDGLKDVENALGPQHTATASWREKGVYNATDANDKQRERMQNHCNKWERIIDKLKS